jgi:hypothetical protein
MPRLFIELQAVEVVTILSWASPATGLALAKLVFEPHHRLVFNKSKGGDPMSSDFVFQNVASADCPFGKQSSR